MWLVTLNIIMLIKVIHSVLQKPSQMCEKLVQHSNGTFLGELVIDHQTQNTCLY